MGTSSEKMKKDRISGESRAVVWGSFVGIDSSMYLGIHSTSERFPPSSLQPTKRLIGRMTTLFLMCITRYMHMNVS